MTCQSLLLVISQIFLKFGIERITLTPFNLNVLFSLGKCLYCWLSGLFLVTSAIIWIHVLKKYEFSQAYPLISISYIFALLAAAFIFHESVPLVRWIGVLVIIAGITMISVR